MQVHRVQFENVRQPVYRMEQAEFRLGYAVAPSDRAFLKRGKILFCGTVPFLARPKDRTFRVCCDLCEFTLEDANLRHNSLEFIIRIICLVTRETFDSMNRVCPKSC